MKFKSETIQSIYDFLEQDADISGFKRDLIAVAEYKKVVLQDLEAECLQYADLIKEDLSNKITFVFREDGYLGMFGDYENIGSLILIERTPEAYRKLKTGDNVSAILGGDKKTQVKGIIWNDIITMRLYIIQNDVICSNRASGDWKKYGKYNWVICYVYDDDMDIRGDHSDLKLNISDLNLITNEKEIEELKSNMHFALVI